MDYSKEWCVRVRADQDHDFIERLKADSERLYRVGNIFIAEVRSFTEIRDDFQRSWKKDVYKRQSVISDLSHFKVEGEIADTYGDRVAAGGKAIVKIGSEKLEGSVSSVTPLSKNGVISFTVQLNEDNNRRLRSGLKTDVYVMNAVKEDVMRITNASYYVGRGEYELFVRDSDKEIVKSKVPLGDSNFEFVEVISGLQPGDEVVVSDMSSYKNKNKLKLK